ncbi:MAG: Type IV-A pilus assembly ATPase PilB [Parcubacteria group bacterium GW2011_GWC1_45_9]|nr:MAG: Type IV-A pilus assembly ATPase PilB [Parcubacteria group bacterium GW2011_GWC1_45_9]
MAKIPLDSLKKLLIESGIVKQGDFDSSQREAERTGRDVFEILVSRGLVSPDYMNQVFAGYYKLPLVKLVGVNIQADVLNLLPEDVARTKGAVAFEKTSDGKIKIAMLDPGNLETIKFLERYLQKPIEINFSTPEDLRYAFSLYRREIMENFQKLLEEQLKQVQRLQISKAADLAKIAGELPVVAIVDNLIAYAAALNSSDIHLEIFENEVLIRFRIDGLLREVARLSQEIHAALVARIKILSGCQIDEHSKPQDGRIRYQRGNDIFDIRVAIMPTFYGEKVTMRLLMASTKPLSFSELGMTKAQSVILEKNIKKTFGMVLSTGPTSSGKTTTQYSILSFLNRQEVNIVTVEDPIEYELRYINQTQINPKAGIDFASGLRAFLRHDPNIIMVGEIRDSETAEIATHAALTGHLVLSTLHTNDAPTAVPRLMDMGVPQFLVSATLNLVMAQRLVRRVCDECIESYPITDEQKNAIFGQLKISVPEKANIFQMPQTLFRGKGCQSCHWTGFRGRMAVFEILDVDAEIRDYISQKDFTLEGLKRLMNKKGMKTMFEDGLDKSILGMTTVDEVLRVIRE